MAEPLNGVRIVLAEAPFIRKLLKPIDPCELGGIIGDVLGRGTMATQIDAFLSGYNPRFICVNGLAAVTSREEAMYKRLGRSSGQSPWTTQSS
jgi:hypothetical protein